MLDKLLGRHRDFAPLVRLVSPSFFRVVPGAQLTQRAWRLAKSTQQKEVFNRQLETLSPGLRTLGLAVDRHPSTPDMLAQSETLTDDAKKEAGERVLRAYFYGLLHPTARTPVDLRPQVFHVTGNGLHWAPRPVWFAWDPAFHRALADLYAGFYGDDPSRFENGLATLNLSSAGDLFIKHFGEGDQTSVAFRKSTFTESFENIFRHCQAHRIALHGDFVPLGLMLAALYDALETLGGSFNVRASFGQASHAL